ncbi:MAG: glycosyltransferase family 4 protein [Bacteroidetes bacterium]|nr:glycosyltransferase family 4 protein [Bacteroidota bacterium]
MLGWEFPPAFTGGLGVACYHIVKALRAQANVSLIVPFAGEQGDPENAGVTGLNKLEQEFVNESLGKEFEDFFLSRIPVELSAYPSLSLGKWLLGKTGTSESNVTRFSTWSDVSAYFQTHDLYGRDILQRTQLFAKISKRIASKRKFDFIYAHDWPTFQAAMELKQDTHKPLVLHIHSLETDRAGEETKNEIYAIEKYAMQEADKIIAVSDYTKHQIVSNYGIDESKITVVHNGAEVTSHSAFKKTIGEKWITFAGRITFQKGPQFIVETACKLIRVYPNVRFIIAGGGDLFASLVHEVARQKLGKYFSFTGFLSREKIMDLLASSDAYFMPSVSEPFGLSAVEAVRQGTASVISKRSGVAEILTNSLKADFWDTDRFANYLYAILKYPRLKKTIEARSRKDIEHLTWETTVQKIMNVYSALSIS